VLVYGEGGGCMLDEDLLGLLFDIIGYVHGK
jgi:hypothetical protein